MKAAAIEIAQLAEDLVAAACFSVMLLLMMGMIIVMIIYSIGEGITKSIKEMKFKTTYGKGN